MKCSFLGVLAIVALSLGAESATAQTITIKLGTFAPEGSAWDVLLKEMGQRWAVASNGQVKLKIFAGGVAGNEGDMLRKMNIGQLQAAALSAIGVRDIDPSPQAIATPGLIADDKEWAYVFQKMIPIWGKRFEDKGYVVLLWGDTGSVRMFFKTAFHQPSDLKGRKVFAWGGDPAQIDSWRITGFVPVVLSATDILPSLSTGMIEGFANMPILVLTARWFERAPYMTDSAWGHLPGATVVSKQTWQKIPAPLQATLKAIAAEYADKVNLEVTRMQAEAIAAMQKGGLTVVRFDEAGKREWQSMAEKTWSTIRGGVMSAADFDEVKKVRDEYRAAH